MFLVFFSLISNSLVEDKATNEPIIFKHSLLYSDWTISSTKPNTVYVIIKNNNKNGFVLQDGDRITEYDKQYQQNTRLFTSEETSKLSFHITSNEERSVIAVALDDMCEMIYVSTCNDVGCEKKTQSCWNPPCCYLITGAIVNRLDYTLKLASRGTTLKIIQYSQIEDKVDIPFNISGKLQQDFDLSHTPRNSSGPILMVMSFNDTVGPWPYVKIRNYYQPNFEYYSNFPDYFRSYPTITPKPDTPTATPKKPKKHVPIEAIVSPCVIAVIILIIFFSFFCYFKKFKRAHNDAMASSSSSSSGAEQANKPVPLLYDPNGNLTSTVVQPNVPYPGATVPTPQAYVYNNSNMELSNPYQNVVDPSQPIYPPPVQS